MVHRENQKKFVNPLIAQAVLEIMEGRHLASWVARKVGITNQTARKYLNILKEDGRIKEEKIGNYMFFHKLPRGVSPKITS